MKVSDTEMRCNICDVSIHCDVKSLELIEHIKDLHKEVYDLHKENPEATVGFRIEFLNLHVLKDDEDIKTQPVIIGEVCEAPTEEVAKPDIEKLLPNLGSQIVVTPVKKKGVRRESETRKKSWVWKYFDRMSNHIYRCTLCDAVLSIKGCNTNNMNRHVRTKHPGIYQSELTGKKIVVEVDGTPQECELLSTENPQSETCEKTQKQLHRRSWIWTYFDRVTRTLAQCKLCKRNICHGGNATGNMNRHLKMIHNKTRPENYDWIWKVFDRTEDDFYVCRICQYKLKISDTDKNTLHILYHLRVDHGVVSGEQIITSTECEQDEVEVT